LKYWPILIAVLSATTFTICGCVTPLQNAGADIAPVTQLNCVATSGLAYSLKATKDKMYLRVTATGTDYTIKIRPNVDVEMTRGDFGGMFFPIANNKSQGLTVQFLRVVDSDSLSKHIRSPSQVFDAVHTEEHKIIGGPIEMLLHFDRVKLDEENLKTLGGGLATCFVQWDKSKAIQSNDFLLVNSSSTHLGLKTRPAPFETFNGSYCI
jgi:hypothetical protein